MYTHDLIEELNLKAKSTDSFAEGLYRIAIEIPDHAVLQDLIFRKLLVEVEVFNLINKG